jgi:20S proteasome alpha/beta subunit
MATEFIRHITELLFTFHLPEIQCLILGLDSDGAHIYRCSDGAVSCEDSTGFAATGIGFAHAEAHFMEKHYTRMFRLDEALLAAFIAKKHGEIAAGVGQYTDVVILGPGPEEKRVLDEHTDALEAMYATHRTWITGGQNLGLLAMNKFVRETLGVPISELSLNPTTKV